MNYFIAFLAISIPASLVVAFLLRGCGAARDDAEPSQPATSTTQELGLHFGYKLALMAPGGTTKAASITFPAPQSSWGTITHAVVYGPNPARKWWTWWRPSHVIVLDFPMNNAKTINAE